MTTPTPVIVINGKEYPGPTADDLSFDEFEIAERLGAPMPGQDEEPDLRQLRWLKALVTIALTRADEDVSDVGSFTVNQVVFKGYPEVNGGPPPNRAARRATGSSSGVAKARRRNGASASPPGSSGHQPTDTTST